MANGIRSLMSAITLALVLATIVQSEDALPHQIGAFGLPSRLYVTSTKVLEPERVQKALRSDPEILWASSPATATKRYLAIVQARTEIGLRSWGFPYSDVRVGLDVSTGQLKVDIDEGPRYRCGKIIVQGGEPELDKQLQHRLTHEHPPVDAIRKHVVSQGETKTVWVQSDGKPAKVEEPIWTSGSFARFDQLALEDIQADIEYVFSELGHLTPRFFVELHPNKSTLTADLHINILTAGPVALLNQIELADGEKNSRENVLEFLGLEMGTPFPASKVLRCEEMLRSSARYVRHKIEVHPRFDGLGLIATFDLVEYPKAPPLSKPFSREEETLLRCREWFSRRDDGRADIVCELCLDTDADPKVPDVRRVRIVSAMSNTGQAFAGFDLVSDETTNWEKVAIVTAPGKFGVYLPSQQRKFTVQLPADAQVGASVKLSVNEKALFDAAEKPLQFQISFNARLGGDEDQANAPLELGILADPVFAIACAHQKKTAFSWAGDILTLNADSCQARIDSKSGELLEFATVDVNNSELRVTLRRNFVSEQLDRLEKASPNESFDPRRPVSSALEFALNEQLLDYLGRLWQGHSDRLNDVALMRCLSTLSRKNVFKFLDDLSVREVDDGSDSEDELAVPFSSHAAVSKQDGVARIIAGLALSVVDKVFERDTWPSTLVRAKAFQLGGDVKYLGEQLSHVQASTQFGPVALLLAAKYFPEHARPLCELGLERLSLENFQRDYGPCLLLANRDGLLVEVITVLRRFNVEEARVIGERVANDGPAGAAFVEALTAFPDDHAAARAIPSMLDALWLTKLQSEVESTLKSMADSAPIPPKTKHAEKFIYQPSDYKVLSKETK